MADGVNVVLTFRDEKGREWLAAAFMGPLQRYDERVVTEECSVDGMKDPFGIVRRGPIAIPPNSPQPPQPPPVPPSAYLALLDAARASSAALAAVVDLHAPVREGRMPNWWWSCAGDDLAGYDAERPDWPCETIRAVALHLGVDVP